MDWKYAHYTKEAVYAAERARVIEATHGFLTEALAGWGISETSEGLEASGRTASHTAKATFRFEPAAGGTKVMVVLLVERASPMGFMLGDVGGYFNSKLRHWMKGIEVFLQHGPEAANQDEAAKKRKIAVSNSQLGERLFYGCIIISMAIIFGIYLIAALIGLLAGTLWLPGRSSGDVTLHGTWARIVSALILSFIGWIAYRIWKPKRRNRGSGWLPPP